MPLSEADTRAKLIDPAIHKRGWTEDLICREESAGSIEVIGGEATRRYYQDAAIRAIAGQFVLGGTEGLENPQIFQTSAVRTVGGLAALKLAGVPAELLRETKIRMFAA